jgi:hypothetical protein
MVSVSLRARLVPAHLCMCDAGRYVPFPAELVPNLFLAYLADPSDSGELEEGQGQCASRLTEKTRLQARSTARSSSDGCLGTRQW